MLSRGWLYIWLGLLLLNLSLVLPPGTQAQERGPIYSVNIEGVVTSVKVDYLQRALRLAEASDATAFIINLSSDGAVLRAIRPFATELAEANVPIVVYITPTGTASGATGAFFLSAADVAAMAPDTSFGTSVPLASVDEALSQQTQDLVLDSVADQLRDWNTTNGRNTAWIDQAVREGIIRTNEQAIATEPPTIDLTARDRDELLTLLEGRVVVLGNGDEVQLATLGRSTTPIEPTLWESLLLILADPTVTFLLLVMGAIAVYTELVTPGIGIAAGISAVLLLGAFVGLLVLPIRLLSLGGLLLAFGLIAADIYLPTHGGLTVTGLVLLIVSSMTLIDTAQAPNVFIALWAIAMVVIFIGVVAGLTIWLVVRTSGQPVKTGQEGLVGRLAEVRQRLDPQGMVFVDGALWRAVSEDGVLEEGEWVRVRSVHDLRLIVGRIDTDPHDPVSSPGTGDSDTLPEQKG